MKAICVGKDLLSEQKLQLSIRFRWPDASFVSCLDFEEALTLIDTEGADLAVVMALGVRGPVSEFCVAVRRFSDIPLVVIGDGQGDSGLEQVKALEAGADEYLLSISGMPEMVARIAALMRRVQAFAVPPAGSAIRCGDLVVDPATYEVYVGQQQVKLTGTEFHLLHLLVQHQGTVVRHGLVQRALWGDSVDSSALVKKYVHRLRSKLQKADEYEREFIRSIYGVGYLVTPGVTAREIEAAVP